MYLDNSAAKGSVALLAPAENTGIATANISSDVFTMVLVRRNQSQQLTLISVLGSLNDTDALL